MSVIRDSIPEHSVRRAFLKLAGEFLAVAAVLLLLTQSFAAHAAPGFDVVCGEQGIELVEISSSDQDENCPNCSDCDDCLANATRTLPPADNAGLTLPNAAKKIDNPISDLVSVLPALTRSQMLRGPPSRKSENFMRSYVLPRAFHMGFIFGEIS